jgi:ABC-type sugar transport system substrate-binding protein
MRLDLRRVSAALLTFIAALVIVALAGMPSPARAQEREPWPEDLGCVTVEFTLDTLANVFAVTQMRGQSVVVTDPVSGDVTITTFATGIPTALNHRFVDGCLYETWEEPLERPAVRGIPA